MTTKTSDLPDAPLSFGFFEMVLEVENLARAEQFYGHDLGLQVADRWEGKRPAVWFALGNQGFLGLWPRESGGEAAIHKGRGGAHVHFAIRVPRGTLTMMQARLETLGHEIESGWEFSPGDIAIYLDDPDGNVVELTERVTLWDGSPATE